MNLYQEYIHKSRYAKWTGERRETWEETVNRLEAFWADQVRGIPGELWEAVYNMDVMPSMRVLQMAGPALERDHTCAYNCAYVQMDRPFKFSEIMWNLMSGTGVGFSVEERFVNELPVIAEEFHETDTTLVVADSQLGWSRSYKELISLLYSGQVPKWDLSKIRPRGARLKTKGGRASGPEPLDSLFHFAVQTFTHAAGRRLNPLEVHDLVCKTGDAIVMGGVRRSALISLSDVGDYGLRHAKAGDWRSTSRYRELANNSAVYNSKPDLTTFIKEMEALYVSKSGERGIFNRGAVKNLYEQSGRRRSDCDYGTNPCGEINLRDREFCNLTEVVVRPHDDLASLTEKVRLATIMGTLQSTLTDFRFLSKAWSKNCEEERLLGVSLTGIMDNELTANRSWEPDVLPLALAELKKEVDKTNHEWAKRLGINTAAAITCVKPSGTVSQLVDSSSGIHPRYAPYYIRRTILDRTEPMAEFLKTHNIPYKEVTQGYLFDFPMKAPEDSVFIKDVSAVEQLEHWKVYAEHWCDHNPSISVYYREEEFLDMVAWLYKNFDIVRGIAMFPYSDDHQYGDIAPYEEIDRETYESLMEQFPSALDWGTLSDFESDDTTQPLAELACAAGACEL